MWKYWYNDFNLECVNVLKQLTNGYVVEKKETKFYILTENLFFVLFWIYIKKKKKTLAAIPYY